MAMVNELASFVVHATYDQLSEAARAQAKVRVLDSLGCAIAALDAGVINTLALQNAEFGGNPLCTQIGGEGTAPDRAAFYNSALVRYLDFNDSFLARGETCHPSDNLAAVLAACEYAGGSGRDLLTALAVAYQVHCRLSEVAPVRARGFDHTTQGAYALAAGVARALNLDEAKTANAIAIAGTANNALRVTRTGLLSNWKGLAYPNTAMAAVHAAFLAMRGITGPGEVFEGNKGFMDAIAGHFSLDWPRENLEKITETIVKRYNAEIHSQATVEGVLELKHEHQLNPHSIQAIDIETFEVAYNIIGGGEEGEKYTVRTKEEADHSLPYIVAVALLDDQVLPDQYRPARIQKEDVQSLLRKVVICPRSDFSQRFPHEMPCRITITLQDGIQLINEKRDYEGFLTRPMHWHTAVNKFEGLTHSRISSIMQKMLEEAVLNLETLKIRDFMQLLGGDHLKR
ncbi:MAG: 2-methylcitrate dehydratase [Anaerolineales bacterium]|nr:MAG: 2-methylcitrate dehydratase [Anaerolineales bacterium]